MKQPVERRLSAILAADVAGYSLSRAGYHPGDPRWAAAARSDAREAPRALTPAACLARSAVRAGLWLSPVRAQRSTARSSFGDRPTLLGPAWHSRRPHQRALRYWNMARQRY